MAEKIRVQLDLTATEVQALDQLRERVGLRSRADAVRTALAIIEWAYSEARNGRKIMAVGEKDFVPLVIPGLTALQRSRSQENESQDEPI